MLILALAAVLAVILMAKHGRRRRRYRRYLRGQIDFAMDVGTLGSKVVVSANVGDTLIEKAWLSSVKATYSLQEYTPAAGDGPLLIGLAHSAYTSAQIEAWIESGGSWDSGNQVDQEIARRKIRRIGIFKNPSGVGLNEVLNDGKPITTKCNWQLTTGQTVRFWVYNMGESGISSADPDFKAEGHANLWPN